METKKENKPDADAECAAPAGFGGHEASRPEDEETENKKSKVSGTESARACPTSPLPRDEREPSTSESSCFYPPAVSACSSIHTRCASTAAVSSSTWYSSAAARPLLKFQPFTLSIDISFWQKLGEKKLREWRLQTPWVPLLAVSTPKHCMVRAPRRAESLPEGGQEWRREKAVSAATGSLSPALLRLDQTAFDSPSLCSVLPSSCASSAFASPPCFTGDVPLLGFLYNCNSLEQFKAFNRQAAISQVLQAPVLSTDACPPSASCSRSSPSSRPPSSSVVRQDTRLREEAETASACRASLGLLQLPVYEDSFWKFPPACSLPQPSVSPAADPASAPCQSSSSSASPSSTASPSSSAFPAPPESLHAPWRAESMYSALPPVALACRFLLITFIDLKAFVAFYSVALPAVRPGADFTLLRPPRSVLSCSICRKERNKETQGNSALEASEGTEAKDERRRQTRREKGEEMRENVRERGEEARKKREEEQKGDTSDEEREGVHTRPASLPSMTEDRLNRARGEDKERNRIQSEGDKSGETRSDQDGDESCFTFDEMVSLSRCIYTLDSGTALWLRGGVFLLLKKANSEKREEREEAARGESEGEREEASEQPYLLLPLTALELLGPLLPDISACESGNASASRLLLSSSHLSALLSYLPGRDSGSSPSWAKSRTPASLLSPGVCTLYLCYLDPSGAPDAVGWPLRNLLLILSVRFSLYNKVLSLLSFRDLLLHRMLASSASLMPHKESGRPASSATTVPLFADDHLSKTHAAPSLQTLVFHVTIPPQRAFVGALSDPLHPSIPLCSSWSSSSPCSSSPSSDSVSSVSPVRGVDRQAAGGRESEGGRAGSPSCLQEERQTRLSPTVVSGWLRLSSASPSEATHRVASSPASSTVFGVALRRYLDGKVIQRDAVELNVQLIRWRILPSFEPRRIQDLRVLLLGAGTLGCGVARLLVAWGVREFTFVDSSCVALSNPARQSLYTYEDAVSQGTEAGNSGGVKKVDAACRRLLAIRPDLRCRGVDLEIPMPGHPRFGDEAALPGRRSLEEAHDLLSSLIDEHDVVMMLTDSKESRWLPSLLVADKSLEARRGAPLGMAVGLGFDSMVVMRQGCGGNELGCYFCNAISAPADSMSNRSLDQQCTVTRPGISCLACSVAVELLAALTQHPQGFAAPHIPSDPLASSHSSSFLSSSSQSSSSSSVAAADAGSSTSRVGGARQGKETRPSEAKRQADGFSCMGATPHTVRGYFSSFRMLSLVSERSPQCVCCSDAILARYRANRLQFLQEVIANSSVLEKYSGLEDMQRQIEARGEDADVICLSDEEETEKEEGSDKEEEAAETK
ncbi:putative autophagy-related protein 7 atg7 [Toxoplasma gondii RUB]|uniref:Putative autophagy-related protein 7 atg7 n=1 Tax=Toxoplasma gondii RUB TaxID=935652 RepID=A0A086M3P4_TOXGO|nr:putative autophagy-related protein 7 atg7 [Toxoplasma gondii RUB]